MGWVVKLFLTGVYVACVVVLSAAFIVGIVDSWSRVGPNCPAPVPADWLGFCDDYDVR